MKLTNNLNILESFDTIELYEMNKVQLLNRFDTKYWTSIDKLPEILNEIKKDYFILEINNNKIQRYKTTYFDTSRNSFYNSHHNGKLNRLKIRKRKYLNSGIGFLEIKKKNNKGKTVKYRCPTEGLGTNFTQDEASFIWSNAGCNTSDLKIKSANSFQRITLVNKNFMERCTIDLNLAFASGDHHIMVDDMVIIELKQGVRNQRSSLCKVLKRNHIYKQGFSKYCIGRSISEPGLKRNQFKPQLLKIKRNFSPVAVSV